MLSKEAFRDMQPLVEFIYKLIDETERKDAELAEVRNIARKLSEQVDALQMQVVTLKRENHAMQLFIEAEVPEEKVKLILK